MQLSLKRGLLYSTDLVLPALVDQASAGCNSGAILSLDLIVDGGPGNQTDDDVTTTGTVSGRGTTIAAEVFVSSVTTSLAGMVGGFDSDLTDFQ